MLRQGTWRATEVKVSRQEINRHGILMGQMVVVMGKEVQVLPELELELEERDRVKVPLQILAMAPADMRVLALEVRVEGDHILGESRLIDFQ